MARRSKEDLEDRIDEIENTEELDFIDEEVDLEVDEDIVIPDPPKKKGKGKSKTKAKTKAPAKKAEVAVKNEAGEELPSEIVTQDGEEFTVIDMDEPFNPNEEAERVRQLIKDINAAFFDKVKELSLRLQRAKVYFKKKPQEYRSWLERNVGYKYQTAQQYMRVGMLAENTLAKAQDLGFTSTHMMPLLGAKSDDRISEFLDKKTHVIDEEGTRKKTAEMKPKDIQNALKMQKIDRGEKPKELSQSEKLKRVVKLVENFLVNNKDRFKAGLKLKGVDEVEPDTVKAIKNSCKGLASLLKVFEKLKERF